MEIPHGTSSGYSFHKCRCDICVTAKRERDAAYYRKNAEAIKKRTAEYYVDNIDEERRKRREYAERNAPALAEVKKAYYVANSDAIKAKVVQWRLDNPERHKAATARYRDKYRAERRAKALARYYKQMAENPEAVREYRRAWAKTTKGVLAGRAARHKRRGVAYTAEALAWIASLVDPVCSYCGRMATEIDHIVPVARGGTGDVTNLAPCCRRCNARKGTQTREEFIASS